MKIGSLRLSDGFFKGLFDWQCCRIKKAVIGRRVFDSSYQVRVTRMKTEKIFHGIFDSVKILFKVRPKISFGPRANQIHHKNRGHPDNGGRNLDKTVKGG